MYTQLCTHSTHSTVSGSTQDKGNVYPTVTPPTPHGSQVIPIRVRMIVH